MEGTKGATSTTVTTSVDEKTGKKTTVTVTKKTMVTTRPVTSTMTVTSGGSEEKPKPKKKRRKCCRCCLCCLCCFRHKRDEEEEAEDDKKKKKPQKLKDFIDEAVKAHNKARKKHGVPDLKHNKELDVLAQRWADHLSTTNVLKHSNDTYKGTQLGENVATKWTSTGEDYTGQEVVDQWYNENQKYNWNNQTFQSGTGHFTQVVWKGSKEVGIGKAVGSDGRVFVVGNYYPAGNVMGQFADNVVPAKK